MLYMCVHTGGPRFSRIRRRIFRIRPQIGKIDVFFVCSMCFGFFWHVCIDDTACIDHLYLDHKKTQTKLRENPKSATTRKMVASLEASVLGIPYFLIFFACIHHQYLDHKKTPKTNGKPRIGHHQKMQNKRCVHVYMLQMC